MVVSLTAAACGGKIADDPNAPRTGGASGTSSAGDVDPGTAAAPSTPEQTAQPFGAAQSSKATVEDACGAICRRNGECGAYQGDCLERCTADILAESSCSPQANAYIHCYADNLEPGCAALPPVCEQAYCAYTQCAGKVVPDYCDSR